MLKRLRHFLVCRNGATAIEYCVILLLISSVVIVATTTIGLSVADAFNNMSAGFR